MPRKPARWSLATLAFVPGVALAHGEGVLLFPLGTLAALAAILLLAFWRSSRPFVAMAAVLAGLAVSIPFWFVPGTFFPAALRYTGWGYFLVGFLPSFATGALVAARRPMHNGA